MLGWPGLYIPFSKTNPKYIWQSGISFCVFLANLFGAFKVTLLNANGSKWRLPYPDHQEIIYVF